MPEELLIQNVRPAGGSTIDVLVKDGRIAALEDGFNSSSPAATVVDGGGRLLLPGLVDAHAHLDKNLLGLPWYPRKPGLTLQEKMAEERDARVALDINYREQVAKQLRIEIASGTSHIRSGVDVDTTGKLRAFDGVMQAKEDFKDQVTLQIVAYPQSGMLIRPGTFELVEEALKQGADVVGGLDPCLIERDPVAHLNAVFGLAEKYDVDVDFHLHEMGELGAYSIELIAERVKAIGWEGRVIIGHTFCLGDLPVEYVDRLIGLLLDAKIAIVSNGPGGGQASPPVKKLKQAGVVVACGVDGVRDTWAPMNMPDMLMRAYVVAHRNGLSADEDLQLALDVSTYGGAAALRIPEYGLAPGCAADFFLVEGETLPQVIIERPARWLVVKGGRIVAREGECLV
jgi:cytosine/adenosine deaminase-related metal-dependent hydrolase